MQSSRALHRRQTAAALSRRLAPQTRCLWTCKTPRQSGRHKATIPRARRRCRVTVSIMALHYGAELVVVKHVPAAQHKRKSPTLPACIHSPVHQMHNVGFGVEGHTPMQTALSWIYNSAFSFRRTPRQTADAAPNANRPSTSAAGEAAASPAAAQADAGAQSAQQAAEESAESSPKVFMTPATTLASSVASGALDVASARPSLGSNTRGAGALADTAAGSPGTAKAGIMDFLRKNLSMGTGGDGAGEAGPQRPAASGTHEHEHDASAPTTAQPQDAGSPFTQPATASSQTQRSADPGSNASAPLLTGLSRFSGASFARRNPGAGPNSAQASAAGGDAPPPPAGAAWLQASQTMPLRSGSTRWAATAGAVEASQAADGFATTDDEVL